MDPALTYRRLLHDAGSLAALRGAQIPLLRPARKAPERGRLNEWEGEGGSLSQEAAVVASASAIASPIAAGHS
jgi:hypothetical protein